MEIENKYCVYRHRKLTNNIVFYIGIGSEKRSKNKFNRSKYWKDTVNKHDYTNEIIYSNLDWGTACELEVFLISLYGRKDLGKGTLCNLTNGGDGCPGVLYSKERNLKISISQTGRKLSNETKSKISETLKVNSFFIGKKGKLNPNSKKVINVETGEIYGSIKEVSELFNIKYTTLKQNLSGYRTNKTIFKYYLEYE